MNRTGISRQLMMMAVALALAGPTALGGLAYVSYQSRQASRTVAASNNRRTDALFGLVEAVGQVQGAVQHLVREKDPDNMEKLMDQNKGARRRQ